MHSSASEKPILNRIQGNKIHEKFCHIVKPSFIYPNADSRFQFPEWDDEAIFGNSNSINIEYCSGNGSWIAARAASNPALNWVAVEMKFGRSRKIWSKIHRHHLNNLFVVNGEGEYVTRNHFPKHSVDKIYINFPDPWPKRYHAKNRLIQPQFLKAMAELLKENGSIIFVTDDAAYSEWTLKMFKESNDFTCHFPAPHYITEWPNYGNSYFENLWREKGLQIRYHQFIKTTPITSKALLTIPLDASQKSTLNWENEISLANTAITNGSKILWDLDFGLFDHLHSPLSNQLQFQAFTLAIKHFSEVIWSQFSSQSIGVCLFRGSFDLLHLLSKENNDAFPEWIQDRFLSMEHFYEEIETNLESITVQSLMDHEKGKFILECFSRDVALDYLRQLAGQLPYGAEPFIQLTLPKTFSPAEKCIFLNKECYRPLNLLEEASESSTSNIGICLPPVATFSTRKNRRILDKILSELIGSRIISEESLITNLAGLDELHYNSEEISPQGKRQLQGFGAAGGRTIDITVF